MGSCSAVAADQSPGRPAVHTLRSERPSEWLMGPNQVCLQEVSLKDEASRRGARRVRRREQPLQGPTENTVLVQGPEVLPGPPKPPSVAKLPQDSTALSTLGTVDEDRAASRPPFSASGGSSSASLASLRLPDLRGRRGPGRKSGCHCHWLLTLETKVLNQPQFPHFALVWELTGPGLPEPPAGQADR